MKEKQKNKLTYRKRLIKKLDTVFSLWIRKRDEKCFTCGSLETPTCGHLFSRRVHSTRWDEENCFQQCWPCNYYHEINPHVFTIVYVTKFGMEKYKEIARRHAQTVKFSDKDLQSLIEKYK